MKNLEMENIINDVIESETRVKNAIGNLIDMYAADELRNLCESLYESDITSQDEEIMEQAEADGNYELICQIWKQYKPNTSHPFCDLVFLANHFKV